jgi:NADPH2:quinone reductase
MLITEDVPDPVAGPGQVVIEVELANVTFVDTQIRAGKAPRPEMLPKLPAILGNGVAGRVAGVGAAGDAALVDRCVMTSLDGTGGYAELAVADVERRVDIPREVGAGRR